MKKKLILLVISGLVASSLTLPVLAAADTTNAIAETGGFSLSLLGTGLNVDIELNSAGNLETVDVATPGLEPEPAAAEATDGVDDPHRFRFDHKEDGTRIDVKSKNHKLTSKVKVATLADLVGTHEWTGVLFPEAIGGDVPTNVTFVVADGGDGPLITDVEVTNGIDSVIEYADDASKAVVVFTWEGYTKQLKIQVDIDDDDDGDDPSAMLKVELRGKDRQRLRQDLASFVGEHVWNGRLCDGTPLTVTYVIDGLGEIGTPTVAVGIGGDAIPVADDGYSIKDKEHGFDVRFTDSKARVRVKFSQKDDGLWELKVDSKTDKCKHDKQGGPKNKSKDDKKDNAKEDRAEAGDGATDADD
ncbi:MAG: hypothetical protein HKO76_01595 [Acidimicrobiia bacterium]|nr:hypothetical protein [Acidimicrobiia bacterium]